MIIQAGLQLIMKGRLPSNQNVTQDLELGDFDGDGDLDIFVANEGQNEILINNGKGFFAVENSRIPTSLDESREAVSGDFDNDGDLDLAVGNVKLFKSFGPQNILLRNEGNGHFKDVTQEMLPQDTFWNSFDIKFHDINSDGFIDLILANGNLWSNEGRNYKAYLNQSGKKFTFAGEK